MVSSEEPLVVQVVGLLPGRPVRHLKEVCRAFVLWLCLFYAVVLFFLVPFVPLFSHLSVLIGKR